MSVWSVESVTEFIRLYREHPCLWKIKSSEYSNRNMRNNAYGELIGLCKQLGFKTANREFVTKKIQNLRGAFRKELKKISETRNKSGSSQDDVYKTSLWYFDLLLFTKDQELPTPSISNMDEDFEATYQPFEEQQPTPSPPQPSSIIASPPPSNLHHTNAEESASTQLVPRAKRERKATIIDTQIKFMNVCTEALKRKEMTEFEGFAVSVAKKLERMNSVQALYSETIINSVLRKGLLNQLTEYTDICDKQCSKVIILSQSTEEEGSQHNSTATQPEEEGSQCILSGYYNSNTFN